MTNHIHSLPESLTTFTHFQVYGGQGQQLPEYDQADRDEVEELCILSDNWHYERSTGRYTHVDDAGASVSRMRSCSSRDSVMTDETGGDETGDSTSPLLPQKNSGNHQNSRLQELNMNISNSSEEPAVSREKGSGALSSVKVGYQRHCRHALVVFSFLLSEKL